MSWPSHRVSEVYKLRHQLPFLCMQAVYNAEITMRELTAPYANSGSASGAANSSHVPYAQPPTDEASASMHDVCIWHPHIHLLRIDRQPAELSI